MNKKIIENIKKMWHIVNETLKRITYKLNDDNISEYAAECAFFTILSFIPCIIFFISLVRYTNIDEETIFFAIKSFIPDVTYEFVTKIIEEVYSKSFGTLSVSVIVALWSAGRGFFSLCKGFRRIYNTQRNLTKFLIRIQGVIYTFIFIIIVIIGLLILIYGNRIHQIVKNKIPLLITITSCILKLKFLITILVLFSIFTFLYKIVSNKKISLKYQAPGALFSSLRMVYFFIIFFFICRDI